MERANKITKLQKIIYISFLTIPEKKRKAHSIQIVRSAVALAKQNVAVDLFVERVNFKDNKELSEYFGMQIPPSLRIKPLPPLVRQSRIVAAVFIVFKSFFEKSKTVFYISDHKMAKKVIKLKWLNRLPVFVEPHSMVFYSKENIGLSKSKNTALENNKRRLLNYGNFNGFQKLSKALTVRRLKYIYSNSDGLILVYKEILDFINDLSIKTPAMYVWHGTEPNGFSGYSFSTRKGVYYTGNFFKYRSNIRTLIAAMQHVKDETLVLVGKRDNEDISMITDYVNKLNLSERVLVKDYVPPGEIINYLSSAKAAVSLQWGIKLADYLSCGVPMVVPDLASIRNVLKDGENCVMFQYGNPESLASAINKVLSNPILAETLARNAYKTAQEYSWPKRAEKIISFINSNMK